MHIAKLHSASDWAFLVLRLVVGAIFLYHGHQKWGMLTAAPAHMSMTMLFIFRFLAIAEPVAAVAVIVGYWTQLASLGLSLVMLSAIYTKIEMYHAGFSGQNGWEFELAVLAGTLVLAFHGAGNVSLDGAIKKNK